MKRYFEPYMLTIAVLFALAAGLSAAWGQGWALPLGLAYMAGCATFAAWHLARAPIVEG